MTNILVSPCGSEIAMEIFQSLKYARFIQLFGGSSVDDHGQYVYQNYIGNLPFFNAPDFIEKLNEVIDLYQIDYIFPAHDNVVLLCAQHVAELHAKVITSSYETADICRHKAKTYEIFSDAFFNPKVYYDLDEIQDYPVLIKPDAGQGSYGVKKIENSVQLTEALKFAKEKMVIVEYLPGEEYTIDCFTDCKHNLKFASMRIRKRTKSGISVCSYVVPMDETVQEIAEVINQKLDMRGMWFFQLKKNKDGEYRLLEIAPRVAGAMCVHRAIGVNLPLLAVYDQMGAEVVCEPVMTNITVDRALINRFDFGLDYDRVIVDYDDTIIIKNQINTQMMMFLYQCKNKKKPIILLTKHAGDLLADMKKFGLGHELFDEIIHIKPDESKADFIKATERDIYIDDSFAERKEMQLKHGVQAFGVDMLEVLLDWRM